MLCFDNLTGEYNNNKKPYKNLNFVGVYLE